MIFEAHDVNIRGRRKLALLMNIITIIFATVSVKEHIRQQQGEYQDHI